MFRLLIALPFIYLAAGGAVIPRYFAFGFGHVIPHGPDHILFILGLFFLCRDLGALLQQLTLFTLAHSLTLGLSLYGVVSVPSRVVEIAIALSISFIAAENLFRTGMSRWRPWMVGGFGLVHGLGFAHVFAERPVERADFLPALFSYNLGIEIGQIAVVGLAFAAVAVWWKRDFYARMIARPASCLIALTGLFWAVERGIGG